MPPVLANPPSDLNIIMIGVRVTNQLIQITMHIASIANTVNLIVNHYSHGLLIQQTIYIGQP